MSDGWGGMFRGAAAGAASGAAFGGWGAIPGAVLGGAYGFFTGSEAEKKQREAQAQMEKQLAPEAYTPYAQTPEGRALYEALMRTGLETAGKTAQTRGMLSTTGMQGLQQRMIQGAGETMVSQEAQMRSQYLARELEKKLRMAGYWQQAGLAQQAGYEQEMGGLMQLGGTMLASRYAKPTEITLKGFGGGSIEDLWKQYEENPEELLKEALRRGINITNK